MKFLRGDARMGEKVLVVDDEVSMRDMMYQVIDEGGYNVLLADGSEKALQIVDNEDIAAVFLDLKLFGMNGIELCKKIRDRKPLTIMYAMTGWQGLFEIEECREAGFDDYFTKPLKIDMIYKAIDEALEKRSRWRRLNK
jgi:DNA-binding NtrC family response regulator